MAMRFDLHTHSSASDGTLAPGDLVQRAAQAGIQVLALTDHDTTAGIGEARVAAQGAGVHLIPGAEISTSWGGRTVHILGLGIDPKNPVLQAGLQRLRAARHRRAEEIGRRLAQNGIPDALAGAQALSNGQLLGRGHFARFLLQRGYGATMGEVFQHFLIRGKPGYVRGKWAQLGETVAWIRAAGGQAVIAHPARYGFSSLKMLRLIEEFKAAGGVGLEVLSGSHRQDEVQRFARQARKHHLLASCGSDYHGPEDPHRVLGQIPPLPAGCLPIWRDWPLALSENP